jgi:hypothetical protein
LSCLINTMLIGHVRPDRRLCTQKELEIFWHFAL